MMMAGRFINLMMKDLRVGGSSTYWLSRMRPEKDLFYTSAEEAAAQEKLARRFRGKLVADSMMDLPPPEFRIRSPHTTLALLPFYGLFGGGSRVVVVDSAGHTLMYHAHGQEGCAEMLAPTNGWLSPISLCITNPMKAVRSEALYAIDRSNSANFKSLTYCGSEDVMAWRWLDLPDPPYFSSGEEDQAILSHALLGDDNTICFSGGFGTYCYDTYGQEWTKAGSWALPFNGRALQVPELNNLHFGFSNSNPDNLVALDLSSPLERPKVLHRWPGFGPPKVLHRWGDNSRRHRDEWSLKDSNLLYLGDHRLCIAKWFGIYDGSIYQRENLVDMAATLTGVEIVDAEANKATLQLVKHKTRTYIFKDCSIESVI